MNDPLEYIDDVERHLRAISEDTEERTGVDRRAFVFFSLAAAAATTLGVSGAQAQRGAQGGTALTPVPLDEPPSFTFQPYPGGTGAVLQKTLKERGAAAFDRAAFSVQPWTGPLPANDDDIAFLPAHRLSALIKARKLTSARLANIYLARLERLNPTLLCAVTILADTARAEAAQMDAELNAGKYRGPLHGIPYGIKDLFSAKGAPTTWGSEEFEHRMFDEDAEIVTRLRDAGAVLIAKLATGMFAVNDVWFRGQTKNPWDTRRGSSGSSAGPASATAAACVAFGIGTETSGSIVSPARECGLSALRPTYGRLSRYGCMVASWSQDRPGPITRSIEDAAMVFNAIHGVDEKDPSTVTMPFHFDGNAKVSSFRIGVDEGAPPELVDQLRKLGAKLTPIGPRPQLALGGGGESAAFFDYYLQRKAKELGIDIATIEDAAARAAGPAPRSPIAPIGIPGLPPYLGTGGRTNRALDFIQAQRRRHMLAVRMSEFLKEFDMYLPADANADIQLHASTGHPCAVVPYKFASHPAGRGGRGSDTGSVAYNPQPICGVLAGNLYNDDAILSVAHQLQLHADWNSRRPAV